MRINIVDKAYYYDQNRKIRTLTLDHCWKYGESCQQCSVVTGYIPSSQRSNKVCGENADNPLTVEEYESKLKEIDAAQAREELAAKQLNDNVYMYMCKPKKMKKKHKRK